MPRTTMTIFRPTEAEKKAGWKKVGENLLRLKGAATYEELAAAVARAPTSLRNIKAGVCCSAQTLFNVCCALNVPAEELFKGVTEAMLSAGEEEVAT